MGGNLFRSKFNVETVRLPRADYEKLIGELTPKFEQLFTKFNVCPALTSKQDFGDMDVVCVVRNPNKLSSDLKAMFDTNLVFKNGTTTSFVYKNFQIDLIASPDEEFEFCKFYFGSADAGNFYGKLAHSLGCKFGHDGLKLPVRLSDDHLLGEVVLTRDPRVACEFLDVEMKTDFDYFEDVFENVSKSKYFNPESYKLENNNAVARVRDKKRPMYRLFLSLCELYKEQNPDRKFFQRSKDKSVFLPLIYAAFPHVKEEYEKLIDKKNKLEAYREKFNGDIVKEKTGLEGKELGRFMTEFKSRYSQDDVLIMTPETIDYMIKVVFLSLKTDTSELVF